MAKSKSKKGRSKKDNALIVGIAIGAAATYILLCNRRQTIPTKVVIPTRAPSIPSKATGSVQVRQLPRAARVGQFFKRAPKGYSTLGVYHAM